MGGRGSAGRVRASNPTRTTLTNDETEHDETLFHAAQDRQNAIDQARPYGELAAQITEDRYNTDDTDVIRERAHAKGESLGVPPADVDRMLDGHPWDIAADHGVSPIEQAGETVPFDPTRHHAVDRPPAPGTPVTVIRSGADWHDEDHQPGQLDRALVILPDPQPETPADRLSRATSGDEARQALNGLTVPQLKDVATAPTEQATPAAATRMSSEPLIANRWGTFADADAPINFHDDGAIGMAIKYMGQDRHLDIDDDALGNVLGRIATDAVVGRNTSQQSLNRLKQVRDRLPDDGAARRQLDYAIRELDAPNTPAPPVPPGALTPLRQLMTDLHAVPLVRRDPDREQAELGRILNDFAANRTGGLRMVNEIRRLRNRRHESTEGKFDIDRAVDRAIKGLENLQRTFGRKALYPPSRTE